MNALRSAALVAALALSAAIGLAAPAAARAAGCVTGTYCGSLAVALSGYAPGGFITTDAAGTPDGVMSCYYAGALYPAPTCNHKFEWDRVSTKTIYWKADPPSISKVAGAASGSITLTSGTTTTTALQFEYAYPMQVTVTRVGSGTVTSTPAGLNCGATCTWSYNIGAPDDVTVTIVPDPGWTVATVLGNAVSCPPPPITTCVVIKAMYQSKSVYVEFQPLPPTPAPTATPGPTAHSTPAQSAATVVATPTATKKSNKPSGTSNLAADGDAPISWPALLIVAVLALGALGWLLRTQRDRKGNT